MVIRAQRRARARSEERGARRKELLCSCAPWLLLLVPVFEELCQPPLFATLCCCKLLTEGGDLLLIAGELLLQLLLP